MSKEFGKIARKAKDRRERKRNKELQKTAPRLSFAGKVSLFFVFFWMVCFLATVLYALTR
jgi:hypothetical protein